MNEDLPSTELTQRSWFERLSHVLLGDEPQDREDLTKLLRDAAQRNLIDIDALAMIEGVLEVAEMRVRDIMIPRSQMVVVEHDVEPEQFLPVIIESAHSRFPVIGESRDKVVGILLAKDLLTYFKNGKNSAFQLRDVLRPAIFVPESKRLNVLLKEFRANRNHMAIVVDEYGGVAGLVTIEDVLEQIVGEIDDEHDIEEESFITKHRDTSYTVKALTPIEEFNEHFSTDFSNEEFDTIAGLVVHHLGRLPKRGESLTLDNMRFKVLRADSRRIHLLRVNIPPAPGTRTQSTSDV
ncbi:MAG: transporter associated domain-containing protein [Gammaproteobacteria bacterium]